MAEEPLYYVQRHTSGDAVYRRPTISGLGFKVCDVAAGVTGDAAQEIADALNDKDDKVSFTEYARRAQATALYPGARDNTTPALMYVGLKVNGEAGEFAEHVGKAIRDDGLPVGEYNIIDYLYPERRQALLKELGDILWYVSESARQLGSSLAEVAVANLEKVESRRSRGAVTGSGDNR